MGEGQVLTDVSIWICLPFAVMLLLIAMLPLVFTRFWEKNHNKAMISFAVSLPVLIFAFIESPQDLLTALEEYASFISMLAALFIISGGILIKGDLRATPLVNTVFLMIGAVIANIIGTTGASMLLIRPLLQTISERKKVFHIPLFFIFIVSNIGGCLTPLGDPPLFLGYLRGIPFTWTLKLFPHWLTAVGVLLIVFYIWDSYSYKREEESDIQRDDAIRAPITIVGKINLIFLAIVVLAIFFQTPAPYRELILLSMMILSILLTKKEVRTENRFTFYPIIEVAILFAGIFVTMVPLLALLRVKGASLGLSEPWQFFWVTGGLSSFLDNAPTYLTLASLAESVTRTMANSSTVVSGIGVRADLLMAISCGAVFMGANSYIGNGPNLMIKSIAEEQGFKVPHFFEYMMYSGMILIPVFILITFLFFSPL
jgi:Na+/H+ antiporter NhaD/arsenite permease-like protein